MSNTYTYEEALSASTEYFGGDELASKVFVDKYALRDGHGNLLEKTPTDMHWRIAKELARVEKGKFKNPMTAEEIFPCLDHFSRIVPQGSPMYGIGNPYQYVSISNCFIKGTRVLTTSGVKNIEDVQIGDMVPTHMGRYRPVVQLHRNKLNNRKVFYLKCYRTPFLKVTDNHKFLSISQEQLDWGHQPTWNSVEYLRTGDYISIPSVNIDNDNGHQYIDLNHILPDTFLDKGRTYTKYLEEDKIYYSGYDILTPRSRPVNRKWKVDKNFAYFLGLWYGDGCVFGDKSRLRDREVKPIKEYLGITFTFNAKEKKLIEFVAEYGESLFGIKADINNNSHIDGSTQIMFHHATIALTFATLFGRGCRGKSFYNEAYLWPQELVDALVQGLIDSDGTVTGTGDLRVVLSNKHLIESFYHLLRSRGEVVGFVCTNPPINNFRIDFGNSSRFVENCSKTYDDNRLSFRNDSKVCKKNINGVNFVRIDKKEIIDVDDEYVYTLGVEEDHSYSVEGICAQNCFVVDSPLDSYGSIMMADEHFVQISKRRGGVGLDLSHIRPAGVRTNNAARSSTGVIPFAIRYSNSIREVGQDGRRGASLLSLSVHHPEVLEFASSKVDGTKVTGSNISVRLSDEFLNAVENNTDYEQRWPVDSPKPVISKMVSACEVWHKIVELAHQTAEPGLLFWDHILRESPADCYPDFQTVSTNPCVIACTYILTPYGIDKIGNIDDGSVIWSDDGWVNVISKWSTGINKVYRYETTAGLFLGTENHRIVSGGEKITVDEADSIDIITGHYSTEVKLNPQDVMDGLIIGDGTADHRISVYLNVGKDDYDYFDSEIKHLLGRKIMSNGYTYDVATTIQVSELPITYNRQVPERFLFGDRNKVCGFLRGLYSANGSICGGRVTLKASSKQIIEDVQTMLSSVGIRSYYTTNKPTKIKFRNGEYECKQSYDINISIDRQKFYDIIGFIQKYKMDKLRDIIDKTKPSCKSLKVNYDITSKTFVSEEETFDIQVDGPTNTFWSQGCNVSNCGEHPLSKNDACRLTLLNLYTYVNNQFTPEAYFDYDRFYTDAQIAQRFMDDIVDLEIESIDRIIQKINSDPEPEEVKGRELSLWQQIKKSAIKGRRTGTGITALGDAIAAIGVRYGSDESIEVTEKIYKTLKLGCYRASVDMAKELGPFPDWNPELEKNHPFLLRIKDEDPVLYADMQKYGRRNISLLTTAPAGTVSIETQTSSGIEPIFMLDYTRRKKINHNDTSSRIDFIDNSGDKWQEFRVYHPKFKEWMRITGETDPEKSPYYKATAEEIDWRQRVRLQAAATKHLCNSLSSTINLPEDVTVEQVAEIYETAWKAGCKGITVYRKNCRSGVLVETKAKIAKNNSVKRPKQLDCDIYHPICGGKQYFVVVGLLEGEPYEVFAGDHSLPHKTNLHEGIVTKVKQGHYRLTDRDGELIDENIAVYCDNDQEALLRMTSTALRHGSDIKFIVEQLEKVRGHMYSFAKCLCRNLKRYIPDGLPVSNGELCADCQQSSLVRSNGCITCCNCGWSKCA